MLAYIGLVFGAAILAVALAPSKTWAIVLLVPMGAASISFVATNNATLQLRADPSMRGRVMSLNAIAFLGSTPIGAPLLGYLSDVTSPRVALAVGGVATLLAMIPLFVLAAQHAVEPVMAGTEGLVTAPGEAWPTNVVPLVAGEPADAAGAERGERRTS